MYIEVGGRHHRPHFHVRYQQFNAVFAIDRIELIGGYLPGSQRRLVEEWAAVYKSELLDNWQSLQTERPPKGIRPLT